MMGAASIKRRIPFGVCLAGVVLSACIIAMSNDGVAMAATPWWHVNTVSAPASQPGGEGRLVLEVSNLGDAAVNGFAHPVKIMDSLPVGVTATHVYGEGGGSLIGRDGVNGIIQCKIVSQEVTCTYGGPLLTYERFMISITVNIEPEAGTGMNELDVSGGGAPAVHSLRALSLGDSAPAFGTENYELTPEEEGGQQDIQAGSHPFQLTSTLTFNTKAAPVFYYHFKEVLPEVQPVALTRTLRFDLPAGLVGNPTALPKCKLGVFIAPSETVKCPDNTVIGVATPIVTNVSAAAYGPLAVTSPLYNVEPSVGEPARFGFITPLGPVILDTSVRTGGDYGVVVTVSDIPDDLGFIGSQVTFWGVPGDSRHDTSRGSCLDEYEGIPQVPTKWEFACSDKENPQPFLIMPTSCTGPLKSTVQGESWYEIGHFSAPSEYEFPQNNGVPVSQDGCNRLNFDPSISVAPDGTQASTPSGLTVGVHVDQEASLNPTGLADSTVKDTTVTLPAGVALNPAGADGLSACSTSQIALESPEEQTCPDSAKVGTVEINTPLLPNPLVGAAYLATQNANPFGSLVALYLVAHDPVSGVLVKLAGEVTPQEGTGQLVSTFKETPQLPFEDLKLHFFGGSRAPLGTPALCGSYTTMASITPWSGGVPAQPSSEFQITSGPGGIPCADPLPFAPSLTSGSSNIQAGAFSRFTMTMSREDGNQNLDAIQLKMPPGLSGMLTGVPLCGEAQANAGTCGAGSLIGETTVSVGLGGDPYTVRGGKVYITGPYEGAPFGLSIVNPAKAGPFDLGQVIVRAKIEIDPTTAALTITSDSSGEYKIPQFIKGIPLQIKHVNVTVNRPGFTFNPTNCDKLAIGAALDSSQGAVSSLSVPFQVTNCATLDFKPIFKVSTSGKTSRANGASLSVKLTYPNVPLGTQANIRSVKVDLPKQLVSRLSTLQNACLDNVFYANPAACPSKSRVGMAKAITPILPVPLEGPAYFVSHGGAKFPELIVVLQGYGVTVDLNGETFIAATGITSSTFRTVPDVPVGSFELTLPEGHDSALAANGNLCKVVKSVLVTKRLKVRSNGRMRTVTRKLRKTLPAALEMPTAFTAQNGAVIHQSTKVSVSGCGKPKTNKSSKPPSR